MSSSWTKCFLKTKPTISILDYKSQSGLFWVPKKKPFRNIVMEHSYFSLESMKNFFHPISCLFVHMVPLLQSVPDFESWCLVGHISEEGVFNSLPRYAFYEWESLISFLRTGCLSHQTRHTHFQLFIQILILEFWTQSFVLKVIPKQAGKLRHVL